MVSYSVLVSAGYFAQQGGWPLVAMFAVLLAGAMASVGALARPAARPRGNTPEARHSRVGGGG